jgi:hypothetical protein
MVGNGEGRLGTEKMVGNKGELGIKMARNGGGGEELEKRRRLVMEKGELGTEKMVGNGEGGIGNRESGGTPEGRLG